MLESSFEGIDRYASFVWVNLANSPWVRVEMVQEEKLCPQKVDVLVQKEKRQFCLRNAEEPPLFLVQLNRS